METMLSREMKKSRKKIFRKLLQIHVPWKNIFFIIIDYFFRNLFVRRSEEKKEINKGVFLICKYIFPNFTRRMLFFVPIIKSLDEGKAG